MIDFYSWITSEKGGPGSGNFGHAGRPGKIGGSSDSPGGAGPEGPARSEALEAMTSDLVENASEIVQRMKDGGFSFRPTKGFHEIGQSGYAVSLPGHEAAFKGGSAPVRSLIDHWMKIREVVLDNPKLHLGGWHDTDNDVFCLDASEIITSRKEAIRLGIERKQKSIFDFKRGVEIVLNADEGRLSNVKEEKEMTHTEKLKAANVLRTVLKVPKGSPEEEWEALKSFAEALGLNPTEEDKAYFLGKLAEQKK